MTPLPKRRHSTRRQGKRTAARRIIRTAANRCGNCGSFKPSHHICPQCGFYAGKQVVIPKVKKESKNQAS